MKQVIVGVVLAALAVSSGGCRPPRPKTVPVDAMPVVFKASFEGEHPEAWKAVDAKTQPMFKTGKELRQWQPKQWLATDAKGWKIVREGSSAFLSLHRQSENEPPVTSPRNFILLPNVQVTSFALDAKMQSTSPASQCRSLCVIFGYQSPTQYYYAHIADHVSRTSHAILVVDGQARWPITRQRSAGVKWGDGWHHVRVVRRWGDGAILVYFDDMSAPIITAVDQRFDLGRIGIGSFDDLGNFDDITVRGVRGERVPEIEPDDIPRGEHLKRAMEAAATQPAPKKPK